MENEKQFVLDIITEAFDKNKSANYVIKQDKKRVQRLRSLIGYSYNICKRYGKIYVNENEKAVCLVNYPHYKKNLFFSIGQDLKLILNAIGVKKLPLVLKRESVIKGNHPKEPFCHLWYIAVHSSAQGNGNGTRLLQTVIEEHDSKNLPIYLETSMDENVPWYEKNGFEVYKENRDFGFTTYMIRRRTP